MFKSKFLAFKKILRYITIYGIDRTMFKVIGRMKSGFSLPSFVKLKQDIAVIGCGQFGFSTIGYFVNRSFGNRFIGSFDKDKQKQNKFEKFFATSKKYQTPNEIFESSDVKYIYIASNHASHTDYAIEAIKNSKIVYIEKPISVEYGQFKNLITAKQNFNANIFVGYNRPFSGAMFDFRKFTKIQDAPFTISCFISGHFLDKDHWYRNPDEGTRICGNMGHWLDLSMHILALRSYPKYFDILIAYSSQNEIDENITVVLTSSNSDLITITLTARCEPFEGINETVNIHHAEAIVKIDDFRTMTMWQNENIIKKSYWPKDVGHKKAIMQPFAQNEFSRNFKEIEYSTLLMLFITDMAKNKITNATFNFNNEWQKLFESTI